MPDNKKIQKMKLDAELLAAGVKPTDLKAERDTENSEKLVNICLILSIFAFFGDFFAKSSDLIGSILSSAFSIMSIAAIALSFWGIIVLYGYHKKSGLNIRRQILELLLALALGILNFII